MTTAMKSLASRLAIVLAVAALYEWFVDEAIVSEAIAAGCVGIVVLLVHERIVRATPPQARVSADFIGPFIRRVLPAVIRESYDLLGPTLWRALIGGEHIRGRWIALRYDPTDRCEAYERTRRAIVVAASNLTPNALPLDVDPRSGRLILHQLVARREAAASDPRYPM